MSAIGVGRADRGGPLPDRGQRQPRLGLPPSARSRMAASSSGHWMRPQLMFAGWNSRPGAVVRCRISPPCAVSTGRRDRFLSRAARRPGTARPAGRWRPTRRIPRRPSAGRPAGPRGTARSRSNGSRISGALTKVLRWIMPRRDEVRRLEPGNQREHPPLLRRLELGLEADEVPVLCGEVVLAQLDHRLGPPPGPAGRSARPASSGRSGACRRPARPSPRSAGSPRSSARPAPRTP